MWKIHRNWYDQHRCTVCDGWVALRLSVKNMDYVICHVFHFVSVCYVLVFYVLITIQYNDPYTLLYRIRNDILISKHELIIKSLYFLGHECLQSDCKILRTWTVTGRATIQFSSPQLLWNFRFRFWRYSAFRRFYTIQHSQKITYNICGS